MNKDSSIYIAGHRGLVGSGILRHLQSLGYRNIVVATHRQLDLCDQPAVHEFFAKVRPEYVFLAAAKVGGIHANRTYPVEFLRDNLLIQTNVIDAAHRAGAKKLLFLGSSCIYPKFAQQPISEDELLKGELEPTNEWYAIAKIAGLKLCQAYRRQYGFDAISVMPTNIFGPGDSADLQNSHVLPALMSKIHTAHIERSPEVVVWGTGTPRREFLFVDDLARACCFLMDHYEEEQTINVGWGKDISIGELAALICDVVGYRGKIVFDTSMPDGTPRKQLDTSRINALGWYPQIELRTGVELTYRSYVDSFGTTAYAATA
jgi:GDP-L-fucose synthase